MGAKDLYLLQIVQYSSGDAEKNPTQWAFFVHYTDKVGNPTGEGETHGVEQTQNGLKYVQRPSPFTTPRFRGACTLGLFYKKILYRILEELEEGRVGVRKSKKPASPGGSTEAQTDLASIPRLWVEDRLEALRRSGLVLLGPSLEDMMRKAYQAWVTHEEETNQRGVRTSTPPRTSKSSGSQEGALDMRLGDTSPGDLIKRYYCYPFVHYATS